MNYKTTTLLGYEIFSDSLDKIDIRKNNKLAVNTINHNLSWRLSIIISSRRFWH